MAISSPLLERLNLGGRPTVRAALEQAERYSRSTVEGLSDGEQEQRWRAIVRQGLADQRMTPEVVAAYAGLHLQTESGRPVQPAAHHRLWLQLLCDDRIERLLILAPPEAAKTTWIVSAWAGCRLGFWPEDPIIIASATGPIATKRTLALRQQTQTLAWQTTFPGVRRVDEMTWHYNEWSIAPRGVARPGRLHPSCSAFGVDGSVTGARARIIVGDDIVTRENSKTQYQRDEVKTFISGTLAPRRLSEGRSRLIYIGTPYHPDDVYALFRSQGRYVICRTPLLQEHEPDDEGNVDRGVYAELEYPNDWPYEMLGEELGRKDAA